MQSSLRVLVPSWLVLIQWFHFMRVLTTRKTGCYLLKSHPNPSPGGSCPSAADKGAPALAGRHSAPLPGAGWALQTLQRSPGVAFVVRYFQCPWRIRVFSGEGFFCFPSCLPVLGRVGLVPAARRGFQGEERAFAGSACSEVIRSSNHVMDPSWTMWCFPY